MFDLDHWHEIFDTLRRNLLRTALTAMSVAWGTFMLVLLIGAGTGLQNGVEHGFQDDATNSLWLWGGRTSMPFEGHAVGRDVRLAGEDHDTIRDTIDGVEHITGRFHLRGTLIISYENKKTSFDVRSVHPDHLHLEKTIMVSGRFLNDLDLAERRKVAVIGAPVARFLFGNESPLGRWIHINSIAYQVVGTFEDAGDEGEMRKIYIPITTAQMAYGGQDRLHQLMFTLRDATVESSRATEREVRDLLARRHHFHPADQRALGIRNNVETFERIRSIFTGIRAFVSVVGAGTILAGIVGVSNIMLISVKERTREIGIRKALGATPRSIIGQIVQEAVFITAVSGYLGMVAGIGLVELVRRHVPPNDFFRDPQVDFAAVLAAAAILVASGALAGFVPARRAARVNPIVALRDG